MLKVFLKNLEDRKRPLLGPNYWILSTMGLILPENLISKMAYIIIHETVTLFVITQYIELYVIRSDLDLVITNLRISMLSIVCIVKANTFVIWQTEWKDVIEYITEADKFERAYKDLKRGKILDSYSKYCRRVTYFYWILVFITFISVISTPLIRYLSSASYREGLRNGTELFPHIFSSWTPFDKYTSPGSWITVLLHIVFCAYGAGIMAAYDATIIVIMVFFGGKFDLLRERCKKIYDCSLNGRNFEEVGTTIQELHNIHVLHLKYSRLFNSLLSPVMFLYVVMCSLMLCASTFQLTSAVNATHQLLMAEYLVFGVAQLFMFCWHSSDVLSKFLPNASCVWTFIARIKSNQVAIGPYESKWWAVGAKERKNVLILAGQLKLVHVFTAGPFTMLTLTTFITILKGAYSYYTLLRK